MSEFFLCEIENIEKSGVEIKVTGTRLKKDDDDCNRIVRTVCFDFSEHDKVFEDKIAELKAKIAVNDMNYKTASELLGKYQQENESLKQRIAELESKETESVNEMPDSITIDGYKCKIIKTKSGLYISRDEIYSIIDKEKEPLKQKCKEVENRHQSDCNEINRLNTTIDVLIHKVEYLRQFAGLE